MSKIISNVENVRRAIALAAERAGRDPQEVTLVAVTKTRTVAEIQAVIAAGVTHLGENRVQELAEKFPALSTASGAQPTWHLIGSLQTNKAKQAAQMASLIHSVDRDSLAAELAKMAERLGKPIPVLVQVNVSGEASKHGVSPEGLLPLLRQISGLGGLQVQGLMTIAPQELDPEAARPHFRALRRLAEQVRELAIPGVTMKHLSMGMSGDFAVAVEEGATLVRVGTAIFGARSYPTPS